MMQSIVMSSKGKQIQLYQLNCSIYLSQRLDTYVHQSVDNGFAGTKHRTPHLSTVCQSFSHNFEETVSQAIKKSIPHSI